MRNRSKVQIALAALILAAPTLIAQQQTLTEDGFHRQPVKPPAVEFLFPGQITLAAGKPTTVELHFRVVEGLHINSHTPREKELIPTTLTFAEDSGVRLQQASYPPGVDYSLPVDPDTKLSVYTGEFVIQARMVATASRHLVEAKLRYQACDQNACMPPRTITIPIDVIGK